MGKMRINYWLCKCGYKGDRAGGGSIGYDKDGEVISTYNDYGCPCCGNKDMEWKSEIVETYLIN